MTDDNKKAIENIQQRLAYALKEDEAVGEAYKAAAKAYADTVEAKVDELRKKLESEHAETTAALKASKEAIQASESKVKALREEAKARLNIYTNHGDKDDKKPLDGFARRDSITHRIYGSDGNFVTQAAKAGYYFLLQPNTKAISTFVKAFATVGEHGCMMPDEIEDVLPMLGAKVEYTWTISDATLLKNAPDTAPEPIESDFAPPKSLDDIPF